jgi:uncharacterized protein
MPSRLTYPGVYVEEKTSGVKVISGVSTSVTLFMGMAKKGQIGVPTPVRSIDQYHAIFGDDVTYGEMTAQVRQFFLNGGTDAVIVRGAAGADQAAITLQTEAGNNVLRLQAKDAGDLGNLIRAKVDYDTANPELTFNIELYRRTVNQNGAVVITDNEFFGGLSMDPGHPGHVQTILNAQSALVQVDTDTLSLPAAGETGGFSQSGLVNAGDADALATAILAAAPGGNITIAVDSQAPVTLSLPAAAADFAAWAAEAENNALAALQSAGLSGSVSFTSQAIGGGQALRITSDNGPSVVVTPAASNDATAALQLGAAAGGIEIGAYSRYRPAPSGIVTRLSQATTATFSNNSNLTRIDAFAQATRTDLDDWSLAGTMPTVPATSAITFSGAGTTFLEGDAVAGLSFRNIRLHLDTLVASLAAMLGSDWNVARHGLRLALMPNFADSNAGADAVLSTNSGGGGLDISTGATAIAQTARAQNTAAYALGDSGTTLYQDNGLRGTNGTAPSLTDYQGYFSEVERSSFVNLICLPRGDGQTDANRLLLWGPMSSLARKVRAFLIVDPPAENGAWSNVDAAASGIGDYRMGTVTDHAAIYWPRISVGFRSTPVDPCGTIAGVMARTDTRQGVWKAPAGLTARTLGATGFEHLVTDPENGITNPQAINTLRRFAQGGVVWGARTMAGFENSGEFDYAYVPVRRMALFLEESLYRGLKFAVFEPNDYRLWAQIRLAAGAFMQNLFRQGAFQGEKASDAYQVICDETTTTQNDINLGRVNVIVMFAPLRPAEFVVLKVQQLAGQVST